MKVGDLVSIEVDGFKSRYLGLVLDLYDEDDPDGEARILWDDGTIEWEKIAFICLERGSK